MLLSLGSPWGYTGLMVPFPLCGMWRWQSPVSDQCTRLVMALESQVSRGPAGPPHKLIEGAALSRALQRLISIATSQGRGVWPLQHSGFPQGHPLPSSPLLPDLPVPLLFSMEQPSIPFSFWLCEGAAGLFFSTALPSREPRCNSVMNHCFICHVKLQEDGFKVLLVGSNLRHAAKPCSAVVRPGSVRG